MAASDWTDRFTGAYATPNLVGREALLARIRDILVEESPGPRAVFIMGPGGIGKTRLLDAALKEARAMPTVQAARSLIDLYHLPTHTNSGLADAIFTALTPPIEPFQQYERERRAFDRLRLSGEVAGMADQRDRMLEVFGKDLQALAAQQRIVLALDTAERLAYGAGQMPAQIAQMAEAWTWLVESLPRWGNVVLVVAGRAEAESLYQMLKQVLGDRVTDLYPESFSEDESMLYFESVVQAAHSEGEHEIARRVAALDSDTRRKAHFYAGGQPILLALLVDALSVGGIDRLSAVVGAQAPVPPRDRSTEQHLLAEHLEEQLIARLKETPRIGDTVLALGRAPKGADSDLLARLLEIPIEEATARLAQVRRLSFVKIRPADDRIFLHDEMYALLRRQVYDGPADAPQAARAERAIISYYDKQLEISRRDLDELYAPVERDGRDRLDLGRLAEVHTRRQTLLTEIVYYRLRQDAIRGFQRYYRYSREADHSGDTALDVQLQAEMLAFLAERDPEGQLQAIDGLERNLALWVVALRPVVRAFTGRKYKQALEEATHLRREGAELLAAGVPASEAILSTWEAAALTAIGGADNFGDSRKKLDAALESLKRFQEPATEMSGETDARLWYMRAVLASAYRQRAYLQRIRGFMQDAVEDYRRAAAFSRQVNLRIELAVALNDMGFALSELGHWADARALVEDALEIRRQLGPRSPVGLSLNTLALIDTREGAYASAIGRLESALGLFRALQNERGVGLALIALADAQRRYAGTPLVLAPEEKIALLREARDHAREAQTIFDEKHLNEHPREVEALINDGTACRDWVKIRRVHPHSRDNIDRLFAESDEALRRAADLAGTAILYRRVDALINRAWLCFVAGRDDRIENAVREAEEAIPAEYHIGQKTGQPGIAREQAQIQLWPQLGKLHMLYGHQAFDRYATSDTFPGVGRREALIEAVSHYLWALQYNALYSSDYQGIRKSKDEVYEQLKEADFDGLRAVANKVLEIEREFHLGESVMRELLQHRALWYE